MANKEMYDGNTAAATIAHAVSEICAIYPITPSSNMGELADEMSAAGKKNIWGTVPEVVELQSEGGASGAVHGALTAGALATTFTASQGLLLMIPNMHKIAGELASTVFHVSARSLACQALSIFGDHSDVMDVRATGFALLASNSIQEVMDLALIAHAATLETRVPFVHFFDGFRTSHEVQKIEEIGEDIIRQMISDDLVLAHRRRGLSPDRPALRGTSQNPDVYFQGRETVNPYYLVTPKIVQKQMDKFAKLTGRQYKLFDYAGAPDAEKVIIIMGSGAETVHETVNDLVAKGKKVGVLKVRLFRPFDIKAFIAALPPTVKAIATLDRTKEPGSIGEPLYLDVRTAIGEAMSEKWMTGRKYPRIRGGRYGLGSKEFTPSMVKAVFDNLGKNGINHFTVGINDDVSKTSLKVDSRFQLQHAGRIECKFYGLGADGTVGANKNSIKIIGDETENYAQGYFEYDSKKAGAITISHLRFGPTPIQSPYLCTRADFVACHQFSFLEKYDMLKDAREGAVFLLNSPYSAEEVWTHMPDEVERQIVKKKIKFYVIDAVKLAKELNLGSRINTIMQTCFFQISGVLPPEKAIEALKKAIRKTYGRKGEEVVAMNFKAVDSAVANLHEVAVPLKPAGKIKMPPVVAKDAPDFVRNVTATIMSQRGNDLPVSAMPADGTWPTGTTKFEKRNIAIDIPVWDANLCIQCGQCSLVCPHAAIRVKVYGADRLVGAPKTFKSAEAKGKEYTGMKYTVQVAPEDCTGCGVCVQNCPAREKDPNTRQETGHRAIDMTLQLPLRKPEAENFEFFMAIPDMDPKLYNRGTIKGSQFVRAMFEFSGACAGCGETPYVKLMTQLFGDRALIANATGCSSIYGGNLPTTPYTTREDGRGPAWSNSLFEDNAEFGYGMRLAVDKFEHYALDLIAQGCACSNCASLKPLMEEIRNADQSTPVGIEEQRARVAKLKEQLAKCGSDLAKQLISVADYLVKKSVWAVGGDGWAYDIGYGGLDHVLASGRNINVLVLDTEVYSNTGGQASKATPMGAVARFAAAGKPLMKKDLGMICMTYGNIYVATVALGANPSQTVRAFIEADAYKGPSIIVAYSHCIAHGIDMTRGLLAEKDAVQSGHFPLFRYNPELTKQGKNPLTLDSKPPVMKYSEAVMKENRFRVLKQTNPEIAQRLMQEADKLVAARMDLYQKLAGLPPCTGELPPAAPVPAPETKA
ncbi:MAG: pyruvate:ferredoxin (flavodoxin) oxidoreductase [Verrucomicrobia bacterium]|nr:pyruvate:ferredoxin (flavodoxin) oxidoreductase [Verrucomicrobiota bacterium]MCG2680654.1 pyruvate:ferredoxin (flavodoxin) oxidoreductase [Kiritimatiellia bacterium]MBU4247423.1 pyruvate:ferredoxin (flavodoxin) oxidoreductase [Verrucomicrobiota bacterium]MBU4291481.1 pyruvate:ferredoxin (flavodoxin) oxidoreductase [Verrucomicrobiota bacterium]MBU4429664.1 pyruvate:ferredoxin (flavodoxin) oxidoreductase [Verrucomicrobiota bacterium]